MNKVKKVVKRIKKDRTIQAVLITVVLAILFGTYAWFTSQTQQNININMGAACDFTVTNTINQMTLVPGNEIAGNIRIAADEESRPTFFRIKLEVDPSYDNFFQNTDTWNDVFTETLTSNFYKHGNWYYYKGLFNPEDEVDVLERLIANLTVGNEYQNRPFQLLATIECIQTNEDAVRDLWVMEDPDEDHITEDQATELEYLPAPPQLL